MPTVKKIIPYKLKKLGSIAMLSTASLLALNSCGKDEPEDPNKAKIEALKAQEKQQANEVRAAVEPATKGFENHYWGVFDEINVPRGTNLLDSANVHIKTIDSFHKTYGNHLPEPPANNAAINNLYTKANTYIVTMTELNNLLGR
jgi:hypothetical protein